MTSDELALLGETAAELFGGVREGADRDAATEAAAGWKLLDELGMTRVSIGAPSGAGEPLRFLGALLRAAGHAAFSVPLIDTHVGATLVSAAGLPVGEPADAPCAVALDPRLLCISAPEPARLTVVHPGLAQTVVAAVPVGGAVRVDTWRWSDLGLPADRNIAGEPVTVLERGTLPAPIASAQVSAEVGRAAASVDLLGRSLMIAGAAQRALEHTLRHVGERAQFGRSLAAFQSVQQTAALMSSQVVAASVAAEAALSAVEAAQERGWSAGAETAVLACRVQCSRTAAFVARAAHQLHGAIGFTEEHPLRFATARLTAWRAHGPAHATVATELGRRAFDTGDLWSLIAGPDERRADPGATTIRTAETIGNRRNVSS